MAMTKNAFESGSTCPPLKDDILRIYSMRYCPFAHRTRLVLHHKNIPFEIVNIHLKKKPDWYLEKNPFGTVPTLEQGDKIVYESNICNVYLDEAYPGEKLISTDPYQKARDQILIDTFGRISGIFFKVVASGENKEDLFKELKRYEQALKERGNYFGGNKPNMVDYTIWPLFERFVLLENRGHKLDPSEFPCLTAYIKRMKEVPAVKAAMMDDQSHEGFMKSYLSDPVPNYDYGL
ncbi:hypothetical protein LOTGIDRAFT_204139 [Lottia gigantea]|uniref:Glutathione S-transferase omega n=1 Tax=Lottia gigantea TaxID=225164 RepID=V4BQC1_LOTGI|nr:hypothetical protein LOTGIDRAFT_204139 [Lottia gigantea]ESO91069.1 hypothetical protein LOTGIDRAFT_204139 [Lottia gigantea]